MRRTGSVRVVLLLVAAAAGCQTTGPRPSEAPRDELTVTRTFRARFDAVNLAMQSIVEDHVAMSEIAGLDYSQAVQTTSKTWKTPFRKEASRSLENGERTVTVKVEQQAEVCVVTARVSSGTGGDLARSGVLLDRIGELVDTTEPVGRRPASGGTG